MGDAELERLAAERDALQRAVHDRDREIARLRAAVDGLRAGGGRGGALVTVVYHSAAPAQLRAKLESVLRFPADAYVALPPHLAAQVNGAYWPSVVRYYDGFCEETELPSSDDAPQVKDARMDAMTEAAMSSAAEADPAAGSGAKDSLVPESQQRYCEGEAPPLPGAPSKELRAALGIGESQEPEFYAKMRLAGMPHAYVDNPPEPLLRMLISAVNAALPGALNAVMGPVVASSHNALATRRNERNRAEGRMGVHAKLKEVAGLPAPGAFAAPGLGVPAEGVAALPPGVVALLPPAWFGGGPGGGPPPVSTSPAAVFPFWPATWDEAQALSPDQLQALSVFYNDEFLCSSAHVTHEQRRFMFCEWLCY
eukprot:m51a1_g5104 hypothetical protein (368) ;mRNA; r:304954-307185